MPTEVIREQRFKNTGDGSQEIEEVPGDRQDRAAHEGDGQRSSVPGIFLEAGKEAKSSCSCSSCISGPPLRGCWGSHF